MMCRMRIMSNAKFDFFFTPRIERMVRLLTYAEFENHIHGILNPFVYVVLPVSPHSCECFSLSGMSVEESSHRCRDIWKKLIENQAKHSARRFPYSDRKATRDRKDRAYETLLCADTRQDARNV